MGRIKYIILFITLAVACTQQADERYDVIYNTDAVSFNAAIMEQTKATDISFESGDQISVFATEGYELSTYNYAQNVKYTYSDGLFTTQDELTYPASDASLAFYAVYPYASTYSTPSFTFSVAKNQTIEDSYDSSDLMTASAVDTEDVVDLVFNHRMAKVMIKLNSADLPSGKIEVQFNDIYVNSSVDLNGNTFKGEGALEDVKAFDCGNNTFKVLLPPQKVVKGSEFVEITIGDDTYVWNVEADLNLSSGVEYTFTLTLAKESMAFTSNINPWGSPSDIVSVIPQQYIDILDDYITIYEGTTPPNIEGIWLISPCEMYYDSNGYYIDQFADDHIWFYDQTPGNTLNMRSTQNLGDLSEAEGVFVSGSGNNFTVYFNEYYTDENGAWIIMATVISGTKSGSSIKNFRNAFLILDAYDPNDEYMKVGDFRVVEDGDYSSGQISWPLDTRARTVGKSLYARK